MLYTAKCYWPGVSERELRDALARLGGNGGEEATGRGALYLPRDEVVLCLFDSSSRAAVKHASEQAGLPCERVIETVWIPSLEGGPS